VAKYFYFNLLNGKVCTTGELKNKWDSICKANQDFIDAKKNLAGMGLIMNLSRWAEREHPFILDVDTKYNIVIGDIEVEGCMNPLLAVLPGKEVEILATSFSEKIPDTMDSDMRIKYSLDAYAFNKMFEQPISGIRIHSVKSDKDILTSRGDNEFHRLESTIKGVGAGIKNKVFYVSETPLCSTCQARNYCKFWYV
jgi:hypothetical protein